MLRQAVGLGGVCRVHSCVVLLSCENKHATDSSVETGAIHDLCCKGSSIAKVAETATALPM